MPHKLIAGYGKCWHAPGRCKAGDQAAWDRIGRRMNAGRVKKSYSLAGRRPRVPGRWHEPIRKAFGLLEIRAQTNRGVAFREREWA
jgi:hypothetical protein